MSETEFVSPKEQYLTRVRRLDSRYHGSYHDYYSFKLPQLPKPKKLPYIPHNYPYKGFDKAAILWRDDFTCKMCGFKPNKRTWTFSEKWMRDLGYSFSKLVAHHIDKNNLNNQMENLITLCKKCHAKVHKHKE